MPDSNARAHQQMDAAAPAQPAAAPAEQPVYAHARNAIMDAAYDFRDAHISGCADKKRFAQAALECAVGQVMSTLTASHGQAPDSVLEDAARYRWLRDSPIANNVALAEHFGGSRLQDFDAAIDAARKQGGA